MTAVMMLIGSGILFGIWDICKKKALKDNNVLAVLAVYASISFAMLAFNYKEAIPIQGDIFGVIVLKTAIVYTAWLLMFTALKNLPISIVTPFNTLTPLCSIFLGIAVLGETLDGMQWIAIGIMFVSYYYISKVGKFEVKYIFKNKYFYFMLAGAFLNSISALIDKIVLVDINSVMLQFWFMLLMSIFYIISFVVYKYVMKQEVKFRFDSAIILMSILIVVADRIYFNALNIPSTPISLAMPLKSTSIVVSVIVGGLIFKEGNLKKKLMCTGLLLLGILILFI